jgi:hypothetical protein
VALGLTHHSCICPSPWAALIVGAGTVLGETLLKPGDHFKTWRRSRPKALSDLAKAGWRGRHADYVMMERALIIGVRATSTAIILRAGVKPRQRGLTNEHLIEACRLYLDGWSLARLAERYGVNDMTVRRYLLLAGTVMRSRTNLSRHSRDHCRSCSDDQPDLVARSRSQGWPQATRWAPALKPASTT